MCRQRIINTIKTIDDLKENSNSFAIDRGNVKICVFDDEQFKKDGLAQLNYTGIDVHEDIIDLDKLDEYHIILVDINGVATKISNREQGLAFARNIIKRYPDKIVALYTAMNISNYENIPNELFVIQKPIDQAGLAQKFDDYVRKLKNPKFMWSRLEKFYKENGATKKDIIVLEDLFVNSCLNNRIGIIQSKAARDYFSSIGKEILYQLTSVIISSLVSRLFYGNN